MVDLRDGPIVDKRALIGGCVRLPVAVDAGRLLSEVQAIDPGAWGAAGRVGVHSAAQSLFLRGHAPAEGKKPIEDREILGSLPYIRSLLANAIPSRPLRVLLARLPAGAEIRPHVDSGHLLARSVRVHIAVDTNDRVWMLCNGSAYRMLPGEVWALNNGAEHGVWNRHQSRSRTHLISDWEPTEALASLIAAGEGNLGIPIAEADAFS